MHTFFDTDISEDSLEKLYYNSNEIIFSKKKNLVLIYVESLENTFRNKNIFNKDLLSPLISNKLGGTIYTGFKQLPGTDWTMASLVATQCAIPLRSPSFVPKEFSKQNLLGKYFKKFLPNATCLGDILNRNGYQQVFMQGPDLNFSGEGSFFKSHGYNEVIGLSELIKKYHPEELRTHDWGVPDDVLFEKAKSKFMELYSSDDNFNLTLLTIDTHHPNGMPSKSCRVDKSDSLLEQRIQCSAKLIAEFVSFVEKNDTNNNTVVVTLGDHLMKESDVSQKIKNLDRNVFLWVKPEKTQSLRFIDKTIFHVDLLPEILSLISGEKYCRAGLGNSCRGKDELESFIKVFDTKSDFLDNLWLD